MGGLVNGLVTESRTGTDDGAQMGVASGKGRPAEIVISANHTDMQDSRCC